MQLQKTTTQVPTSSLKQQLSGDYFKQQIALALPKHMTPDRFVRVALTALLKTPKLADCTTESVIQCMLNCSSLGLEPDGRRAHLIPYGNTCTLILDYKGLIELAKRSGDVANIFAQIVCENDIFKWENGEVTHQIDWKNDRGEMYAVYTKITFKDGTHQTEVMTRGEVDAIRKRSKSANNGPWVTDFNEMAKKTVFRRASKWITLSPEVMDALEADDELPPLSGQPAINVSEPPVFKPSKKKAIEAKSEPVAPVAPAEPEPLEAPEPQAAPETQAAPEPPSAPSAKPDPNGNADLDNLKAAMSEAEVSPEQLMAFAKQRNLLRDGADPDLATLADIRADKVAPLTRNIAAKGVVLKQIKGE